MWHAINQLLIAGAGPLLWLCVIVAPMAVTMHIHAVWIKRANEPTPTLTQFGKDEKGRPIQWEEPAWPEDVQRKMVALMHKRANRRAFLIWAALQIGAFWAVGNGHAILRAMSKSLEDDDD